MIRNGISHFRGAVEAAPIGGQLMRCDGERAFGDAELWAPYHEIALSP